MRRGGEGEYECREKDKERREGEERGGQRERMVKGVYMGEDHRRQGGKGEAEREKNREGRERRGGSVYGCTEKTWRKRGEKDREEKGEYECREKRKVKGEREDS